MPKIKVLIVDDSAVIRQLVKDILDHDREIEVVGVASDAYFAEAKVQKLNPDVVTLDVEMPGMDGITFLEKVLMKSQIPAVMISAHTDKHATATLRALELGAVDFVTKPKTNVAGGIEALRDEIIAKVKAAAKANIRSRQASTNDTPKNVTHITSQSGLTTVKGPTYRSIENTVIAIGASTGGTVAIADLLELMPDDSPGIVMVQHMPEKFTKAYADRINELVRIEVKEARNGDRVRRGLALLAPGGKHMLLQRDSHGLYVEVKDGPPVNRHKPSVEVLFKSAANSAAQRVIAVMLTGMGADGAKGMLELKNTGACTIAQNKASCVVFGMPKAAIDLGAVDHVLPIEMMPNVILQNANYVAPIKPNRAAGL